MKAKFEKTQRCGESKLTQGRKTYLSLFLMKAMSLGSLSLLLLALLRSQPVQAEPSFEVRSPLSLSGYKYLLNQVRGGWKSRQDFYIEAYAQGEYLLNGAQLKFRVKRKKKGKMELSLFQRLGVKNIDCGSAPFSLTRARGSEVVLEGEKGAALLQLGEFLLSSMEGPAWVKAEPILSKAEEFHGLVKQLLDEHELEVEPALWERLKDRDFRFLPSHTNTKVRSSHKQEIAPGVMAHSLLGQTIEINSSGLPIVRYEFEVEPKEAKVLLMALRVGDQKLVKEICQSYSLDQRPIEDFRAPLSSAREYSVKKWQVLF